MTTRAALARANETRTTIDAPLPGMWRLGAVRGGIEVKVFFRDKMAVAFIFGLPPILLVLLGSIFGNQAAAQGVSVGQLFTAGMIAGGIMSTSFQYLAIGIATERETGMLKRLSGTPMPRTAYFAGKVVQVTVCTVAETVLLMAVGMLFYHLHLPTAAGPLVDVRLGVRARQCRLLAARHRGKQRAAVRGERDAGDHAPVHRAPVHLRGLRPVRCRSRLDEGRGVVVPAEVDGPGDALGVPARAGGRARQAGSWEHGRIALVLVAWIAAGLVLCAKTFRWQSRS